MRLSLDSKQFETDDRVKCDACGSYNDPDSRPHGGEFVHLSLTTTDGVGNTVYYDGNGSQGCWFCGSPAWRDGASLGDMDGWHRHRKGKH